MKKNWTKLFSKKTPKEEIELHVAGATVRHRNPFEDWEVPRNEDELTREFTEQWVIPFYMNDFSNLEETTLMSFAAASKKINPKIVTELLGDFDWRPRMAGAFFAAINYYQELEEIIGRHLLKSEVCYAGSGYCLALATFSTERSKEFLVAYLEYYLGRKDLWFDQADAYCALEYLDKAAAERMLPKWKDFVSDKPYWDLERSREQFLRSLEGLARIRAVVETE